MKFEFDHKTGMMRPKKDEEIYFAQSQGGGLIVDDKKNNIKYIIERDERITKLFGSFDKSNLNFYDMRDARMISDRVVRLFGKDHKYSDFHYFLRGYHMNENFVQKISDFLDESTWGDMRKRSSGNDIRKENGINNMTPEEFSKYINEHYTSITSNDDVCIYFDNDRGGIFLTIQCCMIEKEEYKISLPLLIVYSNLEFYIILSKDIVNEKSYNTLNDLFNLIVSDNKDFGYKDYIIEPKNGSIANNEFALDVIDAIIENCETPLFKKIIKESAWGDMRKRSSGDIRKEDGRVIGTLEDGTRLILPNEAFGDGELVDFDGSNIYTFNESGDDPTYVAVISDGKTDVYYKYDEDSEDAVNMVRCFEADSTIRKINDFGSLRAIMNQDEWDNDCLDGLEIKVHENCVKFKLDNFYEFSVYEIRDRAIDDAVDMEEDLLDSTVFTKEVVEHFRNILGDDFLDEKQMKEDLKESQETYYDELDEDDAIDELLRREIIEDSEEYFDVDEDGDIDHSLPKFDYNDYKDAYVEKYIDDIDDYIDEYISNFGYDGIESYIDTRKLAEKIIEADGPECEIASYDNVEREERIDYITYYIYRTN